MKDNPLNILPGFCQCGCGQRTKQVTYNDNRNGYKKGEFKRYVNFHNNNKNHLKPKVCVICKTTFLPRKRSRQESQVTCSPECRNTYISRISAKKRSDSLRGRGEGKSYPKIHGRHAHRVVMEQTIGRPLGSDEIVHHKDRDITNYSPNNLRLLDSKKSHNKLHFTKNRKCSVPGCGRKHRALGYCSLHYSRWKRTGTIELKRKREGA